MVIETRARSLKGAAVVAALLFAACSSDNDDVLREPDASTGGGPLAPSWTVEDVHPVSHPVTAGGHAVVQVVENDEVFLIGYDPATGEERWRTPSAPLSSWNLHNIYPNFEIPTRPLVVDDTVVHLAPGSFRGHVYIEAVESRTGERVWRTAESKDLLTWMGLCDDQGDRVCMAVLDLVPESDTSIPALWVVELADGTTDPELTGRMTRTANPWNTVHRPDVVMASERMPDNRDERRVVVDPDLGPRDPPRGEDLWRRSWADLFGDQPFDFSERSDSRVHWTELDDVLVGTVDLGGVPPRRDGSAEIIRWVTSGVEPDSGEVLWTVPGTGVCGNVNSLYLDVPGVTNDPGETDTLVRCELEGTAEQSVGGQLSYEGDSTFSQIDMRSGDTRWSVELPGFVYLGDTPIMRLDATSFAGTRGDGSLFAVDLDSGELRDAEPSEVGWCFSPNQYRYEGAVAPVDIEDPVLAGAHFTQPCDLRGGPQPAPAEVDEGVGAEVAGTFVWIDPAGLHGARPRSG